MGKAERRRRRSDKQNDEISKNFAFRRLCYVHMSCLVCYSAEPSSDIEFRGGSKYVCIFSLVPARIHQHQCYAYIKEALYRIWCGVNRLCGSGVNRLGDTSAFVNPTGQLLLIWRSKTRMDGVGIVFEFYTAPL